MDALALGEGEGLPEDLHILVGEALQIDLDPALVGIVKRDVGEARRVEVAVEVTVDARQ